MSRVERTTQCSWGKPPPIALSKIVSTKDGAGAETFAETLPDGSTYNYTTPAPPSWAASDPELWTLTHKENIDNARERAYAVHWEARTEEKMKEIEILKEAFTTFDRDGSGHLDADEVIAILTRAGGGNPMTKEDAKEFIKMFDVDGDNHMNVSEFIDAMKAMTGAVGMNAKEDAEEVAEMIVDDIGLKIVEVRARPGIRARFPLSMPSCTRSAHVVHT